VTTIWQALDLPEAFNVAVSFYGVAACIAGLVVLLWLEYRAATDPNKKERG